MVRKSVRVSGRLLVSAAISWTLIPIANADAPADAPQAEVKNVATGTGTETGGKQLHTVPEDGMGDTKWLSGATRIVRELTSKRPKEDLVICIAGCVGKQDRVVYAQPTEYVPPKPDQTAEGAPAAPKAAPVKAEPAKPAAVKPATAAVTPDAKPQAIPAATSTSNSPATMPSAPAAESPAGSAAEGVKIPAPINAAKPPVLSATQPAIAPAAAATAPMDMDAASKNNAFEPTMAAPEGERAPDAQASDAVKNEMQK